MGRVRDSKNPRGPALVFTPGEWGCLHRGCAVLQIQIAREGFRVDDAVRFIAETQHDEGAQGFSQQPIRAGRSQSPVQRSPTRRRCRSRRVSSRRTHATTSLYWLAVQFLS
ncbi:DUF397 domain-containing protein [Nocardia spumae]|uniref:DUF397 domain-containing protein n=1 Tax=Nocardia spumae TaxID=2887190 RepID=UPI001D15CD38|nr:DUF397 domain-containing protein [Nocardia spumae]